MKLALIQMAEEVPHDLREDTGMLGVTSIATYLREYNNFGDAILIDTCFDNPMKIVRKTKPDIVGISSVTIQQKRASKLANDIKEERDIPIILGGIHISTLSESLPEVFDLGVIGEGEQTMSELIRFFEKTGEVKNKNINGLVFRENENIVLTKRRKLIEPLDKIPIPDRSLLSSRYYKPIPDWSGKKLIKASMMSSRGCVYNCKFCSSAAFWGGVRFYSAKRVVDEMEYLHDKFDVQMITIEDDFFTLNQKRLKEIAQLMKERGLNNKIKINTGARSNMISDDMCRTLKEIGITRLNFGFETGNERMLKWLKGDAISIEHHKKAINLCVKHGFEVVGSLIFGSPTETIQDMKDTLDFIGWMHEHGVESVWFYVATPYPNTIFWKIAKKRGIVSENMDWEKLSLIDFDNPILMDKKVSRKEFKKIINIARKKKTKYFDVNNKIWKCRSLKQNIKALLSKPETAVSKPKLLFEVGKNLIKGL